MECASASKEQNKNQVGFAPELRFVAYLCAHPILFVHGQSPPHLLGKESTEKGFWVLGNSKVRSTVPRNICPVVDIVGLHRPLSIVHYHGQTNGSLERCHTGRKHGWYRCPVDDSATPAARIGFGIFWIKPAIQLPMSKRDTKA
jgi:hypothetical protein